MSDTETASRFCPHCNVPLGAKHVSWCHLAKVMPAAEFIVKDSGARQEFASGMVRDTQDGKTRFHLVFDGPMLKRFAEHLTKGAIKYTDRNWMLAQSPEEMERYKASAVRHFFQWMAGDIDEDHAAAVFFNINGYEYVKGRQ